MNTRVGILLCLGLAVTSAGCAGRRTVPAASLSNEVANADALVRDGCYRCLVDAEAVYATLHERFADRLPDTIARKAFEVTLLRAVREKELGIRADATLTRARALHDRFSAKPTKPVKPAAQPAASIDAGILLDAATEIAGDTTGLDPDERQAKLDLLQQEDVIERRRRLRDTLGKAADADLTSAYLAIAIDCEPSGVRRGLDLIATLKRTGAPPLLQYRAGICSNDEPSALSKLREADARWAEVQYFEGRYELGTAARAADATRAVARLTAAKDAFPDSLAIHTLLAQAAEMNGDFAMALDSFERILALRPRHVDAELGKTRMLTSLGRPEEAIATATRLIDGGTWHVGDAFYWRAWNRYQTRQLDAAWTDVQSALSGLVNTAVYTLAGSIAYARGELDTAVSHFDQAYTMDRTNCAAVMSAAQVHTDRKVWQSAAEDYSSATTCLDTAVKTARSDLAKIEAAQIDASVKAARLTAAHKRVESTEELGARAALSAALSYLQLGQKAPALHYAALAEGHAATREQAGALKSRVDAIR